MPFPCCFIVFVGIQSFHVEYCTIIIELVKKKTIFLKSDTLRPRLVAENNFIYGETASAESTDPYDLEVEVAYDDDILSLRLCSGGWSSILTFDGLANALGITFANNLSDIAQAILRMF